MKRNRQIVRTSRGVTIALGISGLLPPVRCAGRERATTSSSSASGGAIGTTSGAGGGSAGVTGSAGSTTGMSGRGVASGSGGADAGAEMDARAEGQAGDQGAGGGRAAICDPNHPCARACTWGESCETYGGWKTSKGCAGAGGCSDPTTCVQYCTCSANGLFESGNCTDFGPSPEPSCVPGSACKVRFAPLWSRCPGECTFDCKCITSGAYSLCKSSCPSDCPAAAPAQGEPCPTFGMLCDFASGSMARIGSDKSWQRVNPDDYCKDACGPNGPTEPVVGWCHCNAPRDAGSE
jgi:hypothetical protein